MLPTNHSNERGYNRYEQFLSFYLPKEEEILSCIKITVWNPCGNKKHLFVKT